MSLRYFKAYGRVQRVMFRQTVMRAAIKRGLTAAAENLKVPDRDQVLFLLEGDNSKINEIVDFMRSGEELNSWHARVDRLEELDSGPPMSEFKVTTANVDNFNWSPNVEFYI
mmetsp:Transcript_19518/g.74898  ORF Transcript_19518/g.74898 Transcript_19518/m.74898 type:complete len:112 (+) Transcript_19518:249-584(+)